MLYQCIDAGAELHAIFPPENADEDTELQRTTESLRKFMHTSKALRFRYIVTEQVPAKRAHRVAKAG